METKELMTRNEFIVYAHDVLSQDSMEPLYETISQHNSEVNAFGDSWPGALVDIYQSVNEINSIERQLARLERREPRNFRFHVRTPY